MPQLPTSTAEEYGAEDEIKQYNQEEDDCSDSSTVDVVNDIKDDLLNEDNDNGKSHDDGLYRNHHTSRYMKGEGSHGGVYGSPASVIVGSHRYYDQSYRTPVTNHSSVSAHGGGTNYSSGTQIRMPMYIRDERSYYEQNAWPPSPVAMPSHPSYPVHGYGGNMAQKYGGYRYPPGIPPGVPYYMPSGGYPGMPGRPPKEPKRPHVKKPLNAFMLYMKEQRPKIAAEFTLKESAAINQILGKRWHALDKSEQAKYYEMARKERAIHMQLYPGWSARDNYAQIGRKKKRPRDKNEEMNPKKCRARYGLDRQEQWCKPCRRKKKCIRFLVGADGETREVTPEVADQLEHSDSDENSAATTQIKKENQLPSQINMNIDNQQQQQQQAEVKAEQLLKSISNETRNDSKLSLLNNNSINNDEACHKKQPMTSSYSTEQKNSMSTLMMGHSAEANRTSCSNTVSHFPTNSSSNNFQDNSHSANYHTTTPHENKEHGHILGNENPKSPNMHCNTSSSLQPLEGGGIKSIRASCA